MDLPNILNSRGSAAAAAAAAASDQYADVTSRAMSDTGSERGISPHVSDLASRFAPRSGSQFPGMSMTNTPHLQQPFHLIPNPYPTPTESIDSGYAHAPDEQHLQNGTASDHNASAAKAFSCSTCHKAFARRSDLARHERIHSGIRPHLCEYPGCGKQFIQRSALTVHSRVHTGEKPHMCEHCTKPFSDSSSLARHRRIHSGKRPYKCPYADCQKTFTRRTTLTRHQSHHSGTVEESIAATSATLASRPPTQPQRVQPNGVAYSDTGSAQSSPPSDQNTGTGSPASGEIPPGTLLPRQPGDFFPGAGNFPFHMHRDLNQNSPRSGSTSPSLSNFAFNNNRQSFTSHPNMYGPPPVLEPPAHVDQKSNGSASGSPHLSAIGWQSPVRDGMGSPIPGGHYSFPPEPYGMHPPHLYALHSQSQRPQSTEPMQYETKPKIWGEQLS